MTNPKASYLIDVCHEAANKMGGLYSIIQSKLKYVDSNYKDYLVIGAYGNSVSDQYFIEEEPPLNYAHIFENLKKEGIICRWGKWIEANMPNTILVDASKKKNKKEAYKAISDEYSIDTSTCGKYGGFIRSGEYLLWSWGVGKLLAAILETRIFEGDGVIHFHFLTSGVALAHIRRCNYDVGIVFTDHAETYFGSLAYDTNAYDKLLGMWLKNGSRLKKGQFKDHPNLRIHSDAEKLCFEETDVYTSVSYLESQKTKFIYGKPADVVTPNGIDMSFYGSPEDYAVAHYKYKTKLYDFLKGYFLPYYPLDVDGSLLFFTSGRDDPAKGYDVIVKALGKLNRQLKREGYKNTIFMFFFVFVPATKPNPKVIENISMFDNIRHNIENMMPEFEKEIIKSFIHKESISPELINRHLKTDLYKFYHVLEKTRHSLPPTKAFLLEQHSDILDALEENGLTNSEEDKVKVIFYPAPVSLTDNVLSLDYSEVVKGMHLGIFPSINEPWGYTPVETIASGVLSVTSNLSGFGDYVLRQISKKPKGLYILDRKKNNKQKSKDELADILYEIAHLTRGERIKLKEHAQEIAKKCGWDKLYKYHIKAHNLSLKNRDKRLASSSKSCEKL